MNGNFRVKFSLINYHQRGVEYPPRNYFFTQHNNIIKK